MIFLNIAPSFLKYYKTNQLQVAAQWITSVNGLPLSLNTLTQKLATSPISFRRAILFPVTEDGTFTA
jgi:hypothetical protein